MFRPTDPFTCVISGKLTVAQPIPEKPLDHVGLFAAQYTVGHFDDVQPRSVQPGATGQGIGQDNRNTRKYVLTVFQRMMLYNPSGVMLSPQEDFLAYENYPVLLKLKIAPETGNCGLLLLDYSPQTVNSQIQVSGSVGNTSGETASNSNSNTIGSSTSQSHTYGVSIGNTGFMPSSSATYSHTGTTSQESSATTTSERGVNQSQETSVGSYMSVKDWGAYSLVNPDGQSPSWVFGQEYPWNAIECRKTVDPAVADALGEADVKVELVVPEYMKARLYDGEAVYPPSQLSMYGLNFVTQAQWLVTVDEAATDEIEVGHSLMYFLASHHVSRAAHDAAVEGNPVQVLIDYMPTVLRLDGRTDIRTALDLGLLALAPIGAPDAPPVVGFVPRQYARLPVPAAEAVPPQRFKIYSTTNTLLVRDITTYPEQCTPGAGFRASRTALIGSLKGNCRTLTFRLTFKVVDAVTDYVLHFKHWKTEEAGLKLSLVVNGDVDNPLVKTVTAGEAEGGEQNLLSIALRNQDYASVDYSDFLRMGVNHIDVTLTPASGDAAGYALRAVSLEPA